ncbi:MAG: sensor histidine kinase [Haloarculaceae archaeon]
MFEELSREERRDARRGVTALVALALGLLAINVWLMQRATLPHAVTAIWLVAPGAIVTVLVVVGVWISADAQRAKYAGHVAAWAAIGAVALGIGGSLNAFSAYAEGAARETMIQLVVGWAGGGVLDGGMVDIYDAERRLQRERSDAARREARTLAETLAVVNRVLRHDIRNHATVLQGRLDMLDGDDDQRVELQHQTDRIVELADNARRIEQLVRSDDDSRAVQSLDALLADVASEFRERYPSASIELHAVPDDATVRAHEFVETAVRNVVENAVVHNPDGEPSVEIDVTTAGEYVTVEIADDGPGIPEHELDIRERSDETALEHSSGLGLWLVEWIVGRSGGEVTYDVSERGTVVQITLLRT